MENATLIMCSPLRRYLGQLLEGPESIKSFETGIAVLRKAPSDQVQSHYPISALLGFTLCAAWQHLLERHA